MLYDFFRSQQFLFWSDLSCGGQCAVALLGHVQWVADMWLRSLETKNQSSCIADILGDAVTLTLFSDFISIGYWSFCVKAETLSMQIMQQVQGGHVTSPNRFLCDLWFIHLFNIDNRPFWMQNVAEISLMWPHFKEIVHPKMKFTHPHVVLNLYVFLFRLLNEEDNILKNMANRTGKQFLLPIDLLVYFFHTIFWVNYPFNTESFTGSLKWFLDQPLCKHNWNLLTSSPPNWSTESQYTSLSESLATWWELDTFSVSHIKRVIQIMN